MSIFQKIYDKIKNFHTPRWIVGILKEVQDILISIMIQVGKDYLTKMRNKIAEVSYENISNTEKFKKVFNYGKILLPTIKDSTLNLLIEVIFSRFKKNRMV